MADEGGGGVTFRLLFTVIVAAFGSAFQYGYNVGVVNAPERVVEDWLLNVTSHDSYDDPVARKSTVILLYSMIVSILCLGGLIGGLLVNFWLNLFGLKWAIIATNIFIFIASALMGYARSFDNYMMLMGGRFSLGINAGLGAGLTPMYLTEISPQALRGTIGSCYQLFLTISILIAQIVGMNIFLGTEKYWPLLFCLVTIAAALQVILLPFCANSPRYLYARGHEEDAKKALIWFRGTESVDAELDQIKKEIDEEKSLGPVTLITIFAKRQYRIPLIISCMLMLGQQLSGINAIIYYSTSTFEKAKLGDFAQIGTLCIGVVNVLMTIVSVGIVDKTGRKPLLVFGFGAMAIDTALFCVSFLLARDGNKMASYLCIVELTLFIVFFATGLGSIPWFLISELVSQAARPKIVSMAIVVHWIANWSVGMAFPVFQEMLGPYVFLIFVTIQTLFLFYGIIFIPETKNKPFDEIQALFKSD